MGLKDVKILILNCSNFLILYPILIRFVANRNVLQGLVCQTHMLIRLLFPLKKRLLNLNLSILYTGKQVLCQKSEYPDEMAPYGSALFDEVKQSSGTEMHRN